MKRIGLLIMLISAMTLQGQKYGLSIEAGQSFGILKKDFTDAAFPSNTSYSLGTGQSQLLRFTIFPDSSNWYFSSGLEWFHGVQTITAFKAGADSGYYRSNARTLNALRLQAQLAYRFELKHLNIDIKVGAVLPVLSSNLEQQISKDTLRSATTILKLKNYTSVGFKGGIGVSRTLVPNLDIFLNSDIVLLNTQVRSAEVVDYYDSDNRSLETVYPDVAYRQIQYHKDPTLVRNNETVLPALFKKSQATDKLTYTQSVCSLQFNLGFQYTF